MSSSVFRSRKARSSFAFSLVITIVVGCALANDRSPPLPPPLPPPFPPLVLLFFFSLRPSSSSSANVHSKNDDVPSPEERSPEPTFEIDAATHAWFASFTHTGVPTSKEKISFMVSFALLSSS